MIFARFIRFKNKKLKRRQNYEINKIKTHIF